MTLLIAQVPTADVPLAVVFGPTAPLGDTFRNTGKERLRLKNTAIATAVQDVPAAPVVTHTAGATALLAGTYSVALAWGNASSETPVGPATVVVCTAGDQLNVSVPALPAGMTYGAVYCSLAADSPLLRRCGQTATLSFTITTLPVGAPPYAAAVVVTVVPQSACNHGFMHPSVTPVPLGGAQVDVGPFSGQRFNEQATGLIHLTYTPAASGLLIAVTG